MTINTAKQLIPNLHHTINWFFEEEKTPFKYLNKTKTVCIINIRDNTWI